ncbi:MAG TPA: hypothetical protein VGF64_12540 [Acidimicrobiales bacterium]
MTESEAVDWVRRRLEFEAWLSVLRADASASSVPPEAGLLRGSRPYVLREERGGQDTAVRESPNAVAASNDVGDLEASAPSAGEPVPHLHAPAGAERLQLR